MDSTGTLSSNDILHALWNKNALTKCRLGLADVVTYEDTRPCQWLITGKFGEIIKKRALDPSNISERWKRIASVNDTKFIAVIRQKGRVLKFLCEEAWNSFSSSFGTTDDSIVSVHCYIKSNNNTIYRNKYEVKDKTGRFVTSTLSYSYKLDNTDSDTVYVFHEDAAEMHECRASSLKSIMDLATNTVVRFIEGMLNIKILAINIDYVVDVKSQLWMLWSSDAKYVSIGQFQTQVIPGVSGGDRTGRMSWAGPKYFEANAAESVESPLCKSPKRQHSLSRDHNKADNQTASYQLHMAESILDDKTKSSKDNKAGRKNQPPNNLDSPRRIYTSVPEHDSENKFPGPFQCHGDYCNIHVTLMGKLRLDQGAIDHTMDKLFSQQEMKILRNNKQYHHMLELASVGTNLSSIHRKSIILARQERRCLKADGDRNENDDWKSYPITPRQMQSALGTTSHVDVVVPTTNSDEARLNDITNEKLRRETFSKDMSRYYEEVKVCGVCHKYYLLLDWARNVLDTSSNNQQHKSADVHLRKGLTSNRKELPNMHTSSTTPSPRGQDMAVISAHLQADTSTRTKPKRNTWKTYSSTTEHASEIFDREKFADLDDYLRKGTEAVTQRRQHENISKMQRDLGDSKQLDASINVASLYRGRIMLACREGTDASLIKKILEDNYFHVTWIPEGRQVVNDVLNDDDGYDCILVQKDLPLADAFSITAAVRESEKTKRKRAAATAATQGRGVQPPTKRTAVICITHDTSPSDLKIYMESGMDGCISYPISKSTLLNTVRAAVPHHLSLHEIKQAEEQKKDTRTYRLNALGTLEGSTDSATAAGKMMAISGAAQEQDPTVSGVVQIDADTRIPYHVVDYSRNAKVQLSDDRPFFNLVVCHDMFDTAERMKIFFKPIAQKYVGMQVLLWNYPGQAFTEWREEQLLNNEYHAVCLNELLGQVGSCGTKDFDTDHPFYMLGFGNGSSILSFYSSHYSIPNLRGVINVNGWSFVDSYLAGIMHDCINVFQSAPPSRPDLPVYFYSRFLFSKDYLSKVSVPLALNLYTAVHNPITLKGRLNLCKGVLQTVDVRNVLRDIDCPIICVQSTQDALVRPLHTEPFVNEREGEVRSIFKVLESPRKTCVIWLKSGHEAFQECKKSVQTLLEQILTGFHESHDISFPPAPNVDPSFANQSSLVTRKPGNQNLHSKLLTVEDKFIDNVLHGLESSASLTGGNVYHSSVNAGAQSDTIDSAWGQYSNSVALSRLMQTDDGKRRQNVSDRNIKSSSFTFDPSSSSFEKQDNTIYNKRYQNATNYPEVKEYMSWRLKRNKKRLQRLQGAARIIQAAFRAHIARQLVKGIRRRKAAIMIQRNFRGWLGRCAFLDQARRIWATLLLQRSWRGYVGRRFYFMLRLRIAACANIQRVWRGYVARVFVADLRARRHAAACTIQSIFRRNQARRDAWIRRQRKNAAVAVQRVYRGHLGKRKASAERDRYIFSKSQSQGIEFGRQMLLEHKLHATRLQSEVTLLTQEKVASEEQVEALLEEITSFEEGVRILEKEMHQLSRVEADASAYMDEESKYELREQKIRLDKEFGDMLAKIGNRKDMLNELERKLSSIDKARQSKEEELRTLERKLVVLLEEQQNELRAIKKKQDVRGALLAASHETLMNASSNAPSQDLVPRDSKAHSVVSSAGAFSGPSLQEKKQAAQLMQSTETLMKFGFMSMSMTYFSSLNMVKALRTVSAQDTVMAALADVHAQRAVGSDANGSDAPLSKQQFLPSLKKGQLPGQESLKVSSWSVEDVSRWLQTISLAQYAEAFIDAAVDGEFLYDLNDDDLKNTLGVEHRLHRKKILNCVHRLKIAEAQRDARVASILKEMGSDQPQIVSAGERDVNESLSVVSGHGSDLIQDAASSNESNNRVMEGPRVSLPELMSIVRHSKFTLLKEALDYLPNKSFDKSLVRVPYLENFGTSYVDGYDRLAFHINKADEHGNCMLTLAAQNGNMKIAKYLVAKGANPNHQNLQGHTPAHFAIAYKFFELSQWLFENGADDTIQNKYQLTPYDGLQIE